MNNEIQRKITSLTLMTVMLAGGMTIAYPGMEPAFAAGELSVSASEVGNFAGIQVIEIVVDDDARSDTSESQGIPNVEINGDDVLMAQLDDGTWRGYIANQRAIDTYEGNTGTSITGIYGGAALGASYYAGSDSDQTYGQTPDFLDGAKPLSAVGGSQITPAVSATTTVDFTGVTFETAAEWTLTHDGVQELSDGPAINIGGQIYLSGANDTADFTFDNTGDPTADFIALANEIDQHDNDVDLLDITGNVIRLISKNDGSIGNILITDESGSGAITVVQTITAVDADTISINGETYTAVEGNPNQTNEFNAVSDAAAADTLSSALEASDDDINSQVDNGDNTIVILTVNEPGSLGNTIPITSFAGPRIVAPAFSGGLNEAGSVDNNPSLDTSDRPFIQTYDISDNSDVTITYGTGSTAETVKLLYDYDDDKDISLDRQKYPLGAFIFIDLDDSLLNLSPTAEEFWSFSQDGTVNFAIGSPTLISVGNIDYESVGFEEGPFEFDVNDGVYELSDTGIHNTIKEITDNVVLFRESNDNNNIFVNYDRSDESNLIVKGNGEASVSYNSAYSIIQDTFNGVLKFLTTVDEWYAGVELEVQLVDEDRNLNSRSDETIKILEDEVPYIIIGDPITIELLDNLYFAQDIDLTNHERIDLGTPTNSKVATADGNSNTDFNVIHIEHEYPYDAAANEYVLNYINYDFTAFGGSSGTFFAGFGDDGSDLPSGVDDQSTDEKLSFTFEVDPDLVFDGDIYIDIFSFGQEGAISNGDIDADLFTGDIEDNVNRVNDAIYRFELEETDDNTATYTGTVEYIMINQLNVFDKDTYDNISATGDEIIIIVNEDSDGSDAIRVSYNDVDSTDNDETISAQEDANTHSGKISLDKEGYTAGNTITVTLEDSDLNTDSDTIQTYNVNTLQNWVGNDNVWLVQMLIDDVLYDGSCDSKLKLSRTGFSLIETGDETGIFVGTLKLPAQYKW